MTTSATSSALSGRTDRGAVADVAGQAEPSLEPEIASEGRADADERRVADWPPGRG